MNRGDLTNEFSKGRNRLLTVKGRVFRWIKLLFIPSVAKRSSASELCSGNAFSNGKFVWSNKEMSDVNPHCSRNVKKRYKSVKKRVISGVDLKKKR